jgi:hypothetical protein
MSEPEHVHFHFDPLRIILETVPPGALAAMHQTLHTIMADLTKLQADVAAQKTAIDSAITLLNGLAAQIAALPAEQGAIDQLAADVSAQTASLAAAVTAGTPTPPASPTVPVAPAP